MGTLIKCVVVVAILSGWIHSGGVFAQEFSKEIDQYRAELRQNPNNLEAMSELAKYLSWSGRLEEAIDLYKQILKIKPDHLEAYIGLANVYSWQGKYAESARIYKKILDQHPDHLDARLGLARVYSFEGNHAKSIQTYQEALKLNPKNKDALVGLGRVYGWHKKFSQSEEVLKQALKDDPKNLETLRALANTYKWGEKFTKGVQIELQILSMDPKNIDSMLSLGYMYGELGSLKQSIDWYEKAVKLAPDRADIHALLGLLYSYTAQVDSAANAYKKAIKLQENDIESYIALGRVYSWQDRLEEAEKTYQKAIAINPQSSGAYAGLGQLYFFNGLWDKSIVAYQKSLQIDPFNVEAMSGLKRVQLVKAPTYTTRYNLFINNYYHTTARQFIFKEYEHDFSHEFTYKFSPNKTVEARVQNNQFKQLDKSTGYTDYLYTQRMMSLRLDYPIYKEILKVSGRFEEHLFDDYKVKKYVFKTPEWQSFGYGFLKFEKGALFSIASASREPSVTSGGDDLDADGINNYGIATGYDFTHELSLIGSFFFRDNPKETRDRRDYKGILNYRLPFLKQLELGYEFRYLDKPEVTKNSATARYTDRFFKDKLLLEGFYQFDNEVNSEVFGVTHKNIFNVFGSWDILDWVSFNMDVTFQINRDADSSNFKAFRNYLTFKLDKDTILGKNHVPIR